MVTTTTSISYASIHDNIHIGPSDYVPWQKDKKLSSFRMEGKLLGDILMNLELRLSVEDFIQGKRED